MIGALHETPMYLVQRSGPTGFIVKEGDDGAQKFKISIGHRQTCSCRGKQRHSTPELCKHIVFVTTKVLRVPASNPLVWQLSLLGTPTYTIYRPSLCSPFPSHPDHHIPL